MLKIITALLKFIVLLIGGALLLGGGACAIADIALLGSANGTGYTGAGVILVFLAISIVVALIGWFLIRLVSNKKSDERDGDNQNDQVDQGGQSNFLQ